MPWQNPDTMCTYLSRPAQLIFPVIGNIHQHCSSDWKKTEAVGQIFPMAGKPGYSGFYENPK